MKPLKMLASALTAAAFGTAAMTFPSVPASASPLEPGTGEVGNTAGNTAMNTAGARPRRVDPGISWTTHVTAAGMIRGIRAGGPASPKP